MEYDAEIVDRIRLETVCEVWAALQRRDALTVAGLQAFRGLLSPESKAFLPSARVQELADEVDDALAKALGVDPDQLPGRGIDGVPENWT